MVRTILILGCAFVFTAAGVSGERPQSFFTGNPHADLFNMPVRPDRPLSADTLEQMILEGGQANEKSPWTAGLLSLAVPGAGQFYTENYIKGAVFLAVDIASWVIAYSYDKKGDDQTTEFERFANAHWSPIRYANWTLDYLGSLNPNIPHTKDYYYDLIYNEDDFDDPSDPDPGINPPPFRSIRWEELNRMEQDIGGGFSHRLPYYGEQQYYELIGKYKQFSRGWDDSPPEQGPVSFPLESTSKRFFEYAAMRAKANDHYDVASTFVTVAVANHVISAVEAAWSAARYNSALHAEVRMRFRNTGIGLVPITEAKVKYMF